MTTPQHRPPAVVAADEALLRLRLTSPDCKAACATSVSDSNSETRDLRQLHRLELAVLDHEQPDDGDAASAQTLALGKFGLLYLTAYADDATVRRAVDVGAIGCLPNSDFAGHAAGILRADVAAETASRRAEVAAVRRAIRRERQHIAAELHDGLAQELAGLSMLAATIESEVRRGTRVAASTIADLRRLLDRAQQHCRRLSHSRIDMAVTGGALGRELRALTARGRAVSGIDCRYIGPLRPRRAISDRISHNLYRIAQEALGNAVRHSDGTRVFVCLEIASDSATLSIRDNGVGLGRRPHGTTHGIGVRTMRYRAHELGGSFSIHDADPSGTEVLVRVPFPPARRPSRPRDGGK